MTHDRDGGAAIDTAELERAIAVIKDATPAMAPWCVEDFSDAGDQAPDIDQHIATILNAVVSGDLVLAHRKAEAWQSIETAPKDGTAILATGVNFGLPGRGRHYALARWDRCEHPSPDDWSGWYEPDGDGGPYYWLTHWMPLPEAPQ